MLAQEQERRTYARVVAAWLYAAEPPKTQIFLVESGPCEIRLLVVSPRRAPLPPTCHKVASHLCRWMLSIGWVTPATWRATKATGHRIKDLSGNWHPRAILLLGRGRLTAADRELLASHCHIAADADLCESCDNVVVRGVSIQDMGKSVVICMGCFARELKDHE